MKKELKEGMTMSFTGHRPKDIPLAAVPLIKNELYGLLKSLMKEGYTRAIVGGALGFDTWAALTALELGMEVTLAVPFKGYYKKWPKSEIDTLMAYAEKCKVVVVCNTNDISSYQRRNEYMVDNSDLVIACYNGTKNGGTYNCICYIQKRNKDMINIWKSNLITF